MYEDYKKAVYHEDEDFSLTVEMMDDLPFIHLNIKKASKATIDSVMKKFAEVKALAYFDGYEAIYTYTQDKRMFNLFKPDRVLGPMNYLGKKYEVAEWVLN